MLPVHRHALRLQRKTTAEPPDIPPTHITGKHLEELMALHSPHHRRKTKKTLQPKYKNLDNKLNKLAQTQTKTPTDTHTFFPRVVNKTNILFSKNELNLLEKGPKYNIHSHKRNWLTTLALEAETSITHLPSTDCDYFRKQVAIRIEERHNKPNSHKNTHPELRNLRSFKIKSFPVCENLRFSIALLARFGISISIS